MNCAAELPAVTVTADSDPLGAVIKMLVKLPIVTVIMADPVTEPAAAVIVAVPAETPVTRPLLLTVATDVLLLLQKRPDGEVLVVPSLNVAVASIWTVIVSGIVAVGPTARLLRVGLTKNPLQPPAKATMESAEINPSLRRKACISSNPEMKIALAANPNFAPNEL
jgi:hypothetical protein